MRGRIIIHSFQSTNRNESSYGILILKWLASYHPIHHKLLKPLHFAVTGTEYRTVFRTRLQKLLAREVDAGDGRMEVVRLYDEPVRAAEVALKPLFPRGSTPVGNIKLGGRKCGSRVCVNKIIYRSGVNGYDEDAVAGLLMREYVLRGLSLVGTNYDTFVWVVACVKPVVAFLVKYRENTAPYRTDKTWKRRDNKPEDEQDG